MSWMNSGLVDAAAWAEGMRARLRDGGAAQHGQARMRRCTTRKVQGVIHQTKKRALVSTSFRPPVHSGCQENHATVGPQRHCLRMMSMMSWPAPLRCGLSVAWIRANLCYAISI